MQSACPWVCPLQGKRREHDSIRGRGRLGACRTAVNAGSMSVDHCLAARGFILLRFGLAGGGITSVVPPLAVIFWAADLEKWCALTTSFLVSSPSPRTRTPSAGP